MWRLGWIPYLLIWNGSSIQRYDVNLSVFIYLLIKKLVVKRRILKKWLLTVGSLKDDDWEVNTTVLSYRLRIYGGATAVVINFDEICRFVMFAIVCVLIVLMEFVAEISTSPLTCDWFWQWIGREWNMCPLMYLRWLICWSLISHTTFEDLKWWLESPEIGILWMDPGHWVISMW